MLCLRSVGYSLFVLVLGCYPDSDKIRNLAGSGDGGSDGNPTKPDAAAADASMADTRGTTGDTVPVSQCAATPTRPLYCAASGDYPGGCWESSTECGSIVDCAGTPRACSGPSLVRDCTETNCLPASQCLYQTAGSACAQCVRHKCCKILNDCVADPSCVACSDMNAPASCDDTTTAPPGWLNYLQCAVKYCAGSCT
jgi:hypothetical protein